MINATASHHDLKNNFLKLETHTLHYNYVYVQCSQSSLFCKCQIRHDLKAKLVVFCSETQDLPNLVPVLSYVHWHALLNTTPTITLHQKLSTKSS